VAALLWTGDPGDGPTASRLAGTWGGQEIAGAAWTRDGGRAAGALRRRPDGGLDRPRDRGDGARPAHPAPGPLHRTGAGTPLL